MWCLCRGKGRDGSCSSAELLIHQAKNMPFCQIDSQGCNCSASIPSFFMDSSLDYVGAYPMPKIKNILSWKDEGELLMLTLRYLEVAYLRKIALAIKDLRFDMKHYK